MPPPLLLLWHLKAFRTSHTVFYLILRKSISLLYLTIIVLVFGWTFYSHDHKIIGLIHCKICVLFTYLTRIIQICFAKVNYIIIYGVVIYNNRKCSIVVWSLRNVLDLVLSLRGWVNP